MLVVARPALLIGSFYLFVSVPAQGLLPPSIPLPLLLAATTTFLCASYGWCLAFQFRVGDAHPMPGPIVGLATVSISAAVGL